MIHLPPHVLSPPQSSPIAPTSSRPVRSVLQQTSPTTHIYTTKQEQERQNTDAAGNDQWEAQRAAEAAICQARQALNAAYSNYRRTLDEEQTQVVNRAIDSNDIDEYLDVVDTFRDRRILPTTWTDDHPYTRYL